MRPSRGVIQYDLWITAAISSSMAVFFLLFGYVEFTTDSNTYTHYAIEMVQGNFDPSLAIRPPGYPAMLVLTGYTIAGSLIGVLILQAASGAAIPVIAGAIMQPISRWVAALTSAVMILSLTPFQFINRIHPDQLYVFMMVVMAAFTCRWLLSNRPVWLYLSTLSCLLASSLRPVGAALILVCFGVAVCRRRHLGHAAVCAALFLVVVVGFPKLERGQAGKSFIGQQVFFNAYMWSDGLADAFSSETAAQELRENLRQFFAENPTKRKTRFGGPQPTNEAYERLFGRFDGNPDAQVTEMFVRPQMYYYWLIAVVSQNVWPDGDRILLRASLQHYWQHPWQFVRSILETYRGLTLGPAWTFTLDGYGFDAVGEQLIFFEPMYRDKGIIPTPEHDFVTATTVAMFANKAKPIPGWALWIRRVFAAEYVVLVPVSYLLMLIGAVGFIGVPGPARTISLVVFGLHSVNALALSVLVDPQFRYQTQSIPLAIIGAGIGIYRLATIYRPQHNRLSSLGQGEGFDLRNLSEPRS
jgi:hypothetical protein